MGFIIGGLLFTGGCVFGGVITARKALQSEHIRNAVVDVLSQKLTTVIMGKDVGQPDRTYRYSEDIIFDSRENAYLFLDELNKIIADYGVVSVADMHDLAGIACANFTATKYGWTDLSEVKVIRGRNGYFIKFPRVVPLTSMN